jgi:cytochrome c oxidase assembly protein subunit 23
MLMGLLCSKAATEYFDPCQEAANKSIKCLHRNGGDKTMCADYFQYVADSIDQKVQG